MKVPQSLQNLYADLRDRRMLSIAIVLVAAIIAVPFLLGGGGSEDVPPPPSVTAQAPFEGDEQLSPVVLAEAPGLRDFRQRLAAYKSHNPFKENLTPAQQRQLTGGKGGGDGTTDGTADAGTADTADTGGSTTVPGADTTVPTPGTVDPGSSTGGSTGTDTGASTDPGTSGGTSELVGYSVDVRIGPLGDTEIVEGAKNLDFLPDARRPLVEYVDADLEGTKVVFIVNPAAAAIKGDAKCIRSKKQCQYLVMEEGDQMNFLFEDREWTFQLKGINEYRTPYDPNKTSADEGDDNGGGDPSERGLNGFFGG